MRFGRAGVEHVERHLRAVECVGCDQLVQRRGLADRREADEAGLALLAQLVERGHDVVQHFLRAQRLPGRRADRVVQLKQVDMIALQPPQ